MMKRLSRADIKIGMPLPYSAYDARGTLLLRKGFLISYEDQINRLIDRGLFTGTETTVAHERSTETAAVHERSTEAHAPVFRRIGSAALRLKSLFIDFCSPQPSSDLATRLIGLAQEIHQAVNQDPDSALAAVHLDHHNTYLLAHHVHCAVLAILIGKRLGIDETDVRALTCAALTFDVGMTELHYFEKQERQLDVSQVIQLNQHPQHAYNILKKAGIHNERWLETVRNHHERMDGSGYPDQKSGDNIPHLARILAACDAYTAMIKPKPWRDAHIPLAAMQQIYAMRDSFALDVSNALIKELGMYPPGSIIRLANGEIGVVKKRTGNIQKPDVCSVYDSNGMPRLTPLLRDTNDPQYEIKLALSLSACRSASLIISRIWSS
jgi:HD-GYP domain-containing protein (c-di-GMP phosphodiesterase class II)